MVERRPLNSRAVGSSPTEGFLWAGSSETVERLVFNQEVAGSIPTPPTISAGVSIRRSTPEPAGQFIAPDT